MAHRKSEEKPARGLRALFNASSETRDQRPTTSVIGPRKLPSMPGTVPDGGPRKLPPLPGTTPDLGEHRNQKPHVKSEKLQIGHAAHLSELKPGESGVIATLSGRAQGRLRLMEMGLTPGAHV